MVALCDILGFKSIVRTVPLEQVIGSYLQYFQRVLEHSVHQQGFPSESAGLRHLREQKRVGLGWFSDTVLLYGLDDSDDACWNLIETIGWFLFESTVGPVKLRAGVAYGELFADPDNEIFVGSAIVDAYEIEQAQQWFGGALTEGAAERATSADLSPYEGWLRPYDVPLKCQPSDVRFGGIAVNWTSGLHQPTDFPWSPDSSEPPAHEWSSRPDICAKWMNTRDFHRAACRQCKGWAQGN